MFHIHWHKEHHRSINYIYLECRCGSRKVLKQYFLEGYAPVDRYWLEDKPYPKNIPPIARSGVMKPNMD